MAKNAIFTGTVTRVAALIHPNRTEFTVKVKETKMDDAVFTIGTDITCEVSTFMTQKQRIITCMTNLSVGDDVTVKMEKNGNNVWEVCDMDHSPHRGRPAGSFLNDLEEELAKRK